MKGVAKVGGRLLVDAGWKAALHETVTESTRPAKALADDIDVGYRTLLEWADETSDSQIPTRRLIVLLSSADNLAALRYLAALQGCLVFRAPVEDFAPAAQAVKEFGELMEAYATAVADSQVSGEELARLKKEAAEAMAAIAAWIAGVEATTR